MNRSAKTGWKSSRHVRLQLLPRLIRQRDAPAYLGMDRNKFNAEVRPVPDGNPAGKAGTRL